MTIGKSISKLPLCMACLIAGPLAIPDLCKKDVWLSDVQTKAEPIPKAKAYFEDAVPSVPVMVMAKNWTLLS